MKAVYARSTESKAVECPVRGNNGLRQAAKLAAQTRKHCSFVKVNC
jgi:hypothetical protein